MEFYSPTITAARALARLEESTAGSPHLVCRVLHERAALAGYRVVLVGAGALDVSASHDRDEADQLARLHALWAPLIDSAAPEVYAAPSWSGILDLADPVMPDRPWLLRSRAPGRRATFFFLLRGRGVDDIQLHYIAYLANLWQLEHGGMPVHSCGVIHRGRLFLFGGPSGAGKSTVARLSQERGDVVLDDDQVLLFPLAGKGFHGIAWGSSIWESQAPLGGVFVLKQDVQNRLAPMAQVQVAGGLLERHFEVIETSIALGLLPQLLGTAASIARAVPGYELHFTKSPMFWDLIDAALFPCT